MKNKLALMVLTGLVAVALTSAAAFAAIPQFPNFFYGSATLEGAPAPVGSVVTAVVDHGQATERHYTLAVTKAGKYGGPKYNQYKLKVGGDLQGDIANGSEILFFVTLSTLPVNTSLVPAGSAVFYADGLPHITRLNLVQN